MHMRRLPRRAVWKKEERAKSAILEADWAAQQSQMLTPFPEEVTLQGDDLSPLGQHQNPSTCCPHPPHKRLLREVGGEDTSQGGDSPCGEIILAVAAPWKRKCSTTLPRHRASASLHEEAECLVREADGVYC